MVPLLVIQGELDLDVDSFGINGVSSVETAQEAFKKSRRFIAIF